MFFILFIVSRKVTKTGTPDHADGRTDRRRVEKGFTEKDKSCYTATVNLNFATKKLFAVSILPCRCYECYPSSVKLCIYEYEYVSKDFLCPFAVESRTCHTEC